MITVKQMLDEKGHDAWTVSPEASIIDALKLMAEKSIGALVVMEKDHVVGVVSERDYARKVAKSGSLSNEAPVKGIMTPYVYGVHPANTAEDCMSLMTDKHIRHLPVIEKEKLIGVVSIGDVVKSIMSQQKVDIQHLENYIMGKYQ
jgi:CBS domain-containing protein